MHKEDKNYDKSNSASAVSCGKTDFTQDYGGGYKNSLKIVPSSLRRIGEGYGAYVICDNVPNNAVIFSFGIGEDTQFEEGMMRLYPDCTVYAFDPTPRSIEYVKPLNENKQFLFLPVGLSDKNETETFYMPMNEAYVSCSVVMHEDVGRAELQVEMKELSTLMAHFKVEHIDLLKMDIEGSEFKVLPQIFSRKIYPSQICVEFHERYFKNPKKVFKTALNLLKKNNYHLVYVSENKEEFTFVKNYTD